MMRPIASQSAAPDTVWFASSVTPLFLEMRQFRDPLKGERHEEPSKSALCRGPESDRRHMVLQVMSPAIREIAPELKRDETWLWSMTNCSTKDGEQAFRTLL